MNYIKNNKVFIFLLSMLLCISAVLSYRLLFPKSTSSLSQSASTQTTTAKISTFYGSFNDDKLAVELSWNIITGNKKLEKLILYCNDEQIADVTNSYSISLEQSVYGIITGNNKFELEASFSDGTKLSKTNYVYTDEAYAIKIAQQNMETKSLYTITYYYDKRRTISVPAVHMSGISENFSMNFVSSEILSEEGNMVNMKVVYELLYNDVKPGNYNVAMNFSFSQYNLSKSYSAIFQVATVNAGDDQSGSQTTTDTPETDSGENGNEVENTDEPAAINNADEE